MGRWHGAACLAVLLALPCAAGASDKVYKSTGPDGKVVYSQTPPAEGRVDKQLSFDHLPATALPDYVLKFRAEMERNIALKQKSTAPANTSQLRLFTAKWCGYCRQAQAWLAGRGIAYTALDIDTPQGMTEFVRSSGGKGGVPLLVGPQVRVQGYTAAAYQAALAPKEPAKTVRQQ